MSVVLDTVLCANYIRETRSTLYQSIISFVVEVIETHRHGSQHVARLERSAAATNRVVVVADDRVSSAGSRRSANRDRVFSTVKIVDDG